LERGAEGTLVEGDDLSHKIWGLGIDDSQMVHLPATSKPSIRQTFQLQDHRPPQAPTASSHDDFNLSHYYERDSVIDLSRPATFHGHVGTQRVLSKRVPALPMPTSQQTFFVPASANMKAYSSKQRLGYAPQSEDVFSAPRSSIFDNAAEQHRQPDSQSLLPTPPSTSSPCWTPIFSHQPGMAISKSMVLNLNQKVSKADSYHSPKIYSPISNLEDESSHIRAIMQQNAIHETDVVYDSKIVPRTPSFQSDPFTIQAYLPKLDSPQVDDASCLKATSGGLHDPSTVFPTNHENSLHDKILPQTEAGGGTQGSTERRRNLSYQQPRSIPLARLIQRRLSSVAEEDQSTKILFSFLKEAQTEGYTRLKGLSLESLSRQMPRIGLLDEEIFTSEIFTVQTEADHQFVYEAESMLNSDKPNVVVKLPQKAGSLRHDFDSNGGKKILRYDRQATLNARPTADPSTRHKIRVKKLSTTTDITGDT
jgi:hypothetical protein